MTDAPFTPDIVVTGDKEWRALSDVLAQAKATGVTAGEIIALGGWEFEGGALWRPATQAQGSPDTSTASR